jgi:hypothetical protein
MTNDRSPIETARFLRTLRVATQSAIARHHLLHGGRDRRTAASFLALAAKGRDDWQFPAEGLVSSCGLVMATLQCAGDKADALVLQAQGAAGLSQFGNLPVRLTLNSGRHFDGAFDRDGRLVLALGPDEIEQSDLVDFSLETGGEAS